MVVIATSTHTIYYKSLSCHEDHVIAASTVAQDTHSRLSATCKCWSSSQIQLAPWTTWTSDLCSGKLGDSDSLCRRGGKLSMIQVISRFEGGFLEEEIERFSGGAGADGNVESRATSSEAVGIGLLNLCLLGKGRGTEASTGALIIL